MLRSENAAVLMDLRVSCTCASTFFVYISIAFCLLPVVMWATKRLVKPQDKSDAVYQKDVGFC